MFNNVGKLVDELTGKVLNFAKELAEQVGNFFINIGNKFTEGTKEILGHFTGITDKVGNVGKE